MCGAAAAVVSPPCGESRMAGASLLMPEDGTVYVGGGGRAESE